MHCQVRRGKSLGSTFCLQHRWRDRHARLAWLAYVAVRACNAGHREDGRTPCPSPALSARHRRRPVARGWGKAPSGGFGSIEQVRALFSVDAALSAGWLHYLAFDLFVGSWIVEDGLARGINRFLLIPCLALTFLFGPAGLLLF